MTPTPAEPTQGQDGHRIYECTACESIVLVGPRDIRFCWDCGAGLDETMRVDGPGERTESHQTHYSGSGRELRLQVADSTHAAPDAPTAAQAAWKREEAKAKREALEAKLAQQLGGAGIVYSQQLPIDRWRWDFAVYTPMGVLPVLLIDVQGGTYSGGRHVRGKGYRGDCEKMAAAVALGYAAIWVTGDMVVDGTALQAIERVLHATR